MWVSNDGRWTKCDQTVPGIKPIIDYLKSLPWPRR